MVATPSRPSFTPSPEQQKVVGLSQTQNVVVSARPGAGKTATAEAIVAANPGRSIAVVTYSKRLQLETARRLENYPCADVFTFHGMAGSLFDTRVYNDTVLRDLRKAGTIPAWNGDPYDIIVLDEFQDCTDDLFWLSCAFISSVTYAAGGRAPRVVVLGDERQAIYGFRGADSRYLSLSPELFSSLSPYPWTSVALSNSFRLSCQTSTFVNRAFLGGEEYITGSHNGPRPQYVHADLFDVAALAKFLMPLIKMYGPERTAILTPFVRNNKLISRLTNLLSKKYGIKIAVSISDDVALDDLVLSGKLVLSTYHQFKGNERDLVIVYGVDNAYFKFLGRDLPDNKCPNEIFVALTRARKQLVVMHNTKEALMPFVSRRAIAGTADLVQLPGLSSKRIKTCRGVGRPTQMGLLLPRNIFVSDLPRHAPDETLDAVCKLFLKITKLAAPLPEHLHIRGPERVPTDPARMYHEAVSDISGRAVVAAYEYELLGTLSTLGYGKRDRVVAVPAEGKTQAAWLCRKACQYDAVLSGYQSRSIQMAHHSFDWLGSKLEDAKQRLREQFKDFRKLDFEYELEERNFSMPDEEAEGGMQKTRVVGLADIVQYTETRTPTGSPASQTRLRGAAWPTFEEVAGRRSGPAEEVSIWEIKFVSKLSLEHVIQVSTYAYLWAVKHGIEPWQRLPRVLLFNIRDGEKWEITARGGRDGLRRLVEGVLKAKYSTGGGMPTDEFLKKCTKTKKEVEAFWESHGCRL